MFVRLYFYKNILFIYLYIWKLPNSRHCGVGAHQRQEKRQEGKKSGKSEEKERDRGAEGEIPNLIPGDWCAHRGRREEPKTEEKKKEAGSWSRNQLPWTVQSPPTTRRDRTVNLFFLYV